MAKLLTAVLLCFLAAPPTWARQPPPSAPTPVAAHDEVVSLTDDEKKWIAAHPTIRWVSLSMPPLMFVDDGGNASGLIADYFSEIGGFLGIQFQYVPTADWTEALRAASAHEVDAIAPLAHSADRERLFLYTRPALLDLQSVVMARNDEPHFTDLAQVDNRKWALVKSFKESGDFRKRLPDMQATEFKTLDAAVDAVSLGKADFVQGSEVTLLYAIRQHGITNLQIAGTTGDEPQPEFIGVRSDDPVLEHVIDKALAAIPASRLDEIRKRWIEIPAAKGLDPMRVKQLAVGVLAPVIVIMVTLVIWLLLMRREVRLRRAAEQLAQHKTMDVEAQAEELRRTKEELDRALRAANDMLEHSQAQTAELTRTQEELDHALRQTSHMLEVSQTQAAELTQAQRELDLALRRTNNMLETMMSNSPAAMWAKDRHGAYLFANETFREIFLIPKDVEIVGNHDREFFPADSAMAFQRHDQTVLDTGQTHRFVEQVQRPGRALLQVLSIKFPLTNDHGQVFATGGMCIDLTEQLHLQEELKKLNEQLEQRVADRTKELSDARRQLVEITEDFPGILFEAHASGDGTLTPTFVSSGAETLVGWNEAALYEKIDRYFETVLPDELPGYLEAIERSLSELKPQDHSFRIRHAKSGEVRWLNARANIPKRVEGGLRQRGFVVDITQQKRLEAELGEARKLAELATQSKSEFLANMSHEIRTPMNAVIGMTHLLSQTELSILQRNYLRKIGTAAHNLLGIINDILDVSKIEAGKLVLEETDFSLGTVLDNLTTLISQKAEEKGLEFLFDWDADIPDGLIGDPLRLGQVLTNFCSNAVKFTERGEVVVSVRMEQRTGDRICIRFSVRDTGIGLSPQQRSAMFQAFQQADSSTTRKYGGTGLGLTIAKKIAEMMQGEVGVDSELGKGSTFWSTAWLGVQKVQKKAAPVTGIEIAGRNVLVVDDNSTAREILVTMVQSLRMHAVGVASGTEAMARLRSAAENPFDLVLLDWKMPSQSGIDVARAILADDGPRPAPHIIMVSAYGRDDLLSELNGFAVDGVLSKPVNPSTLFEATLAAFGGRINDTGTEPEPVTVGTKAQRPNLSGARLLLVEDNDINQEIAETLLTREGAQVTIAANGREAIEALAQQVFDLILMDVQMPVMDGLAATRHIRRDAKYAHLPIVAMTANVMETDIAECLAAGMNDHIGKPLDIAELFGKIGRWLAVPGKTDAPAPAAQPVPAVIAGIDLDAGLRVMAGSRELYRKLLLRFRESQADVVDRMRRSLQSGHHAAALLEAHTLKGLAANIGARELSAASATVERLLKSGTVPTLELSEIERHLGPILEAIAGMEMRKADQRSVERRGAGGMVTEVEQLRDSLPDLRKHLEDNDSAAAQWVTRLQKIRFEGEQGRLARALTQAIENYDFEGACERLDQLAASLALSTEQLRTLTKTDHG